MLGRISLAIVIFSCFIFAYLRYFERRAIYYPSREFLFTPADIGLDYRDIFFKTQDGLTLNGWFIPSRNPRGSLLFCHGNAGNISHRLEIMEIFHKLKLNVFIFDYRGYGRSQGRPSEQGLYKDAQAAYQCLLGLRDAGSVEDEPSSGASGINKEPIVIYGKSIGANIAIDLASRVKADMLISDSGFTSAYEMSRILFPYLPTKWMITIKYDALTKIKDIAIPKLIIHSKDDEIVPFALGRRLFEAAARPKEFYQMSGSHNEAIFISKSEYGLRLDSFFNKYLSR